MPRLLLVVAVAALVLAAPPAAAAERPLVYAISIDGLDGDAVDQGEAPFIASLIAGEGASATTYLESRSVFPAETNPNHTAMVTGAYAGRSGIAANDFAVYAPLEDEDSCRTSGPHDPARRPTVTSGHDASCLMAETVFASIRRQGNPDGLVTAAIFGKPKLGRIFAGRTVDPGRRDVDHLWAPCSSGADDDDYCAGVPTNPVTGYAINDTVVMDEVLRVGEQGVRAGEKTRRPDFTFVNLPQVDSAGHAFGLGPFYDAAVGMADDEVRRLVMQLRAQGVWDRTVLVLLSDHSMDTTFTRVDTDRAFADAGIGEDAYVRATDGSVDLVYVADRTDPDRFELLERMRAAALARDGVAEALYREPNPADGGAAHTLDGAHPAWHAAGRRMGDLVLVAEPGAAFTEEAPLPGAHGAPQTRDTFFAVVSGGRHVRQQALTGERDPLFDDTARNPEQAENVDLAPTVMGVFGLAAPRHNRGRFLANAFARRLLPGGGRPTGRPALRVRARRRGARCAYRVTWGPAGGRFDVAGRRTGGWRTIARGARRTALRWRGRPGFAFRVRLRAESGTTGRWRVRTGGCTGPA